MLFLDLPGAKGLRAWALELARGGADFPELVGGDQALRGEKRRVLWRRGWKKFNTHPNVRVKTKVY